MANTKIFQMKFSAIYDAYVKKIERKNQSEHDLRQIIFWLTGYDDKSLTQQIDTGSTMEEFFANMPQLNPNADKITGVICGVRVEDVEDPLMQKIRYLDKLVDELAKGKSLEKIERQ
ncbi:DUF2200 domain-containing protein [Companilactobacillus sp.]|uniref:DUF2200 domain-containing protein n=1 Tax=Companilactobacillus sp. TaxID=2767905 RepID=UPI0025C2F881|nr:DUF2200 domain-containing protein [Companilactobacillus sp.]MCH4008192.1 DUF2200 domain-containing protein [Companilactobacillus sp.]MCH4051629.1 DUF2200 domain-containing protein [Companilactobacillus sp.]MCH4076135.1 DUF2200 domain-containing protein [Companilactobacillus sp.]MCH4124710.1 DUF2200 domain-containing protein [Companilactobacillus sp.]MCH4131252.1 DUF2200 domain-containing protein [Companilactobacillus sp.]